MDDDATKEEWTYKGRRCKIVMDPDLGHYCGYIRTGLRGSLTTTKIHRLVDVNGGITYGVDEDGWIGFDCAHSHDICVDENGEPTSDFFADKDDEHSIVWTPEKVKEEVENLADQFEALENIVHEARLRL